MGDWKLLNKEMKKGNLEWKLFNLKEDPREQNDLASEYPNILQKGIEIWEENHTPSHLPRWQYVALGEGEE